MFNHYLQIWGLQGWEIILIAAIILILFGAKKIPELARSLGRAKAEFKRGQEEVEEGVSEKERLEKVAKELGISTEGKNVEELRKEIQKALEKGS
ncbi:MAG: twin-arginine translocase TatA/TatE family subunit [Nitrososphaerota archaeon]|nr:twin-arginine translocase TatA/TatE family subunit [Nitrososphaerales archaeon]MDW8045377.1 twin-arginine translocase TatA/TatE family subunit [Nitrososphaerota archaeon]